MDPTLESWLQAAHMPDVEFVEQLWRAVLRRPIEPEARDDALRRLAGGMSRTALLADLVSSPEFERVRVLDDAVAWATAQRAADERPRNLRAPTGTDERPIEIPWCLARAGGASRVLDAGYAFAEPAYLAGLVGLGAERLVGVDLAAAEVPRLESVTADLRELPFADGSFDLAIAISTLEHVGRDNTQYGLGVEDDDDSLDRALRELGRVLAPDGRLLVTVPASRTDERRPEQLVLAPNAWAELFERNGFVVYEDELYELGADGWTSVSELAADTGYGERGPAASGVLCAELRARTLAQRLRLGVRDRRHAGEVRRVTG